MPLWRRRWLLRRFPRILRRLLVLRCSLPSRPPDFFEQRSPPGTKAETAVLLPWWTSKSACVDDDVHFRAEVDKRQCFGNELWVDCR